MGIFSKKEKTQVPAVEKPGVGPASVARDKKGNPVTEVRDRRYGGREAVSYNPQATQGSYGSYGNYGQQQPAQPAMQPAGSYGREQQDPSRAALFAGGAPQQQPQMGRAGSYNANAGAGPAGSKPEWADDGDDAPQEPQREEEEQEVDEV